MKEYNIIQRVVKDSKVRSNDYTGIATELAKAGAKDRLFKLYDIKDDKVRLGRNLAALGITSSELKNHKKRADTDGSGRINKSEAMSYLSSLKGSKEKKSVILESIYWYARKYGNPYGRVNKSAKQAADPKIKAKVDKALAWNNSIIVPHTSGYHIDPKTGKRVPNGRTVGTVGMGVMLPAGRTMKELKRDVLDHPVGPVKNKIYGRTIIERLHNSFGSRIGDTKKRTIYPATMIRDIKRHKDGTVDITFANKEVWRNPPKHNYEKDNTKLDTSDGGKGRGRRWRRWRRGGRGGGGARGTRTVTDFAPNKKNVSYQPKSYGTGGGGGTGSLKHHKANIKDTNVTLHTPKITIKPKKSKTFTMKTQNFKPSEMGMTRAELRALLQQAMAPATTKKPTAKKGAEKDVYKVKTSKRK